MKLYKNKEWLEQKYLKEKLSTAEIAKECGVTDTNISYWLVKYNIPIRSQSEALKGKFCGVKNGNYKGGRKKHKGYILIFKPEHPFCDKGGYVPEHRLVMEEHLGRYLIKDEVAHHINEIRDDNRIENLKLFPTKGKHHYFHNKREKNPRWLSGKSLQPDYPKKYMREYYKNSKRAKINYLLQIDRLIKYAEA